MSRLRPFAGKWQILLDTGVINSLSGSMDRGKTPTKGTCMIFYKTGTLSGYAYLGAAQLQPDGVAATKPSALDNSYLTPVPYSGGISRPNGVGSLDEATVWTYNDSAAYPTPALGPYTGPANSIFGWWSTIQTPIWGWLNSNNPPKPGTWSVEIVAPSAFHMRNHTGAPISGGDYTWCDLSGEDYTYVSMRGATFRGADLSSADFSNADLTGSDFRGVASLAGAKFAKANLSRCTFDGIDLTGFDFSTAIMQGATFSGTTLAGANFTGSDLTGVDLRPVAAIAGIVITDTNLTACRIDGMDFTGWKFPGTKLAQASITGTVLDRVQFVPSADQRCDLGYLDFRQPKSFANALFSAYLFHCTFDGLDITGLDFTGADCTGATFRGVDMRPAVFSPNPTWSVSPGDLTDLTNATIAYAQLGANWSCTNLANTMIEDLPEVLNGLLAHSSVITNRNLSSHNLQGGDFTNADLRGTTLAFSNLTNTRFTSAQMQGDSWYVASVFSGCVLNGCSFAGANLTGVAFDGAYFSGAASLAGATVTNARFDGAYLVAIDFSGTAGNECQGTSFAKACLINANFTGTNLADVSGARLAMAQACLQGAIFTEAKLYNADLSGAAVSTTSGQFTVTVKGQWPLKSLTTKVSYNPTVDLDIATNTDTVCPSDDFGPCSGSKLVSPNAPTQWPVTTAASGG